MNLSCWDLGKDNVDEMIKIGAAEVFMDGPCQMVSFRDISYGEEETSGETLRVTMDRIFVSHEP